MIKESALPEFLTGGFEVGSAGFHLWAFQEMQKIAFSVESLSQEMNVIGHDTISVNCEMASGRFFCKGLNQPLTTCGSIE